jgi:hypothetical protein
MIATNGKTPQRTPSSSSSDSEQQNPDQQAWRQTLATGKRNNVIVSRAVAEQNLRRLCRYEHHDF